MHPGTWPARSVPTSPPRPMCTVSGYQCRGTDSTAGCAGVPDRRLRTAAGMALLYDGIPGRDDDIDQEEKTNQEPDCKSHIQGADLFLWSCRLLDGNHIFGCNCRGSLGLSICRHCRPPLDDGPPPAA